MFPFDYDDNDRFTAHDWDYPKTQVLSSFTIHTSRDIWLVLSDPYSPIKNHLRKIKTNR